MLSQNVERLIDRWINDAGFRTAVRRDPKAAVRNAGVMLSEEETAALLAIDWSLSDEQLVERVNKM